MIGGGGQEILCNIGQLNVKLVARKLFAMKNLESHDSFCDTESGE